MRISLGQALLLSLASVSQTATPRERDVTYCFATRSRNPPISDASSSGARYAEVSRGDAPASTIQAVLTASTAPFLPITAMSA